MTTIESAIIKLQNLPEPLLQRVITFIDTLTIGERDIAERWSQWFKEVDRLEVPTSKPEEDYSSLLLAKYRKQGLDL